MKNNLQEIRWEKNWSQKYLSMRSKVPQSVISEIENGNEIPNVLTALRFDSKKGKNYARKQVCKNNGIKI